MSAKNPQRFRDTFFVKLNVGFVDQCEMMREVLHTSAFFHPARWISIFISDISSKAGSGIGGVSIYVKLLQRTRVQPIVMCCLALKPDL